MYESSVDVKLFKDQDHSDGKVFSENVASKTPAEKRLPNEDEDFYDMSGKKYLLIFNHRRFKAKAFGPSLSERKGTDEDSDRLQSTFRRMEYDVLRYNDLMRDELLDAVLAFAKSPHGDTSCVCIAILTHGHKEGVLSAYDRPYRLSELTEALQGGDEGLVGKPKIFLVQACRGGETDEGRTVTDCPQTISSLTLPTHADTLILRSSVEGYVSFRDSNGSFMIQELCQVIEECSRALDVLHIVTLMNRRVAFRRSSFAPRSPAIHNKKQMPETRFTLTKCFRFQK